MLIQIKNFLALFALRWHFVTTVQYFRKRWKCHLVIYSIKTQKNVLKRIFRGKMKNVTTVFNNDAFS